MNALHCCHAESPAGGEARRKSPGLHRARGVAGLIVPGALLALMPKCPMCLAAYVAVCTGFTLSSWSAHLLLRSITVLCLGTLALCLARLVVSCRKNKQVLHLQP
jgi:hypothetical protein